MSKNKAKKRSGGLQRKIVDEQILRSNPQFPSPADKIDHKLLLQVALNVASDTGSFYDTKFFVFSRKSSDGLVYAPKPVYANSWILRTRLPAYFEQLLSDTYGDCFTGDLNDPFPDNRKPYVEDYEYDSDSDLEDDDLEDDSTEETSFAPPKSGHASEASDGSIPAGQTEAKLSESVKPTPEDTEHAIKDGASATKVTKHTGKTLVLKSVAHPTWKALMMYLCTGEVTFSQLKSLQGFSQQTPSPNQLTSPCSPKSMYRLAHRLGLDDLRAQAKAAIMTNITADNVLAELFSDFASTYDDIKDAIVDFIFQDATRRRTILAHIPMWITRFGTGELRSNTDSLICLVNKLAGGSDSFPKQCPNCKVVGGTWRCNHCNYCGTHQ